MQVNCSEAVVIIANPENLDKLREMFRDLRDIGKQYNILDEIYEIYANRFLPLPRLVKHNNESYAVAGFGQNIFNPCDKYVVDILFGINNEVAIHPLFGILPAYGITRDNIVAIVCTKDDSYPPRRITVVYGDVPKEVIVEAVRKLWFTKH